MNRRSLGSVVSVAAVAGMLGTSGVAWAQTPPAVAVAALAERTVSAAQLPAGTLVWRLETLPNGDAAVMATGSTGVAAAYNGRNYLVTLAPPGGATPGATRIAETGPVPVPRTAAQVVLRLAALTGPAFSQSAVHTHPGGEAYYVLGGELGARSQAGTVRVPAGRALVGPPGGTPIQAVNLGASDLNALVMFALDASQPASGMATFADPAAAMRVAPGSLALPATGGAATGGSVTGVWAAAGAVLALAGVLTRRRRSLRANGE